MIKKIDLNQASLWQLDRELGLCEAMIHQYGKVGTSDAIANRQEWQTYRGHIRAEIARRNGIGGPPPHKEG